MVFGVKAFVNFSQLSKTNAGYQELEAKANKDFLASLRVKKVLTL